MRYRSENVSGSGERGVLPVIMYETFELGNTDILDYFIKHHPGSDLSERCRTVSESLQEACELNLLYEEEKKLIEDVVAAVSAETGKDIRYVLWLTDPEYILELYLHLDVGEETYLDGYEESDVIFSDIGPDGTLYGYEEYPEPVSEIRAIQNLLDISIEDITEP